MNTDKGCDERSLLPGLPTSAIATDSIWDAVPAFLWRDDVCGHSPSWNRHWQEYTGLTAEASRGTGWQQAIHPDDLAFLLENWLSSFEVEARVRRSDGAYRWFLFRFDGQGTVSDGTQTRCGLAIDIDERKRAHQELQQNEQQFRTITDLIPQYIVVIAPEGRVLYVNQVALERTGIEMSEVQENDTFWRPFHPEDVERVRAERRLGLEQGLPFEVEVRVRTRDGAFRWHLVQYNPQKNEAGQIIRWYATGTDIDTRKKEEENLRTINLALKEDVQRFSMFDDIVATSEAMRHILQQIAKVAPTDSTILILGETGTGKELVARALHGRSQRSSRVFVRVNCAAIPEALIASELFGHERGAFTGALQRRVGRFEAAHGGTLFLDEVGDMPLETQIALLRVLQEREVERVGSHHPIPVDVRVIAATNRDLPAAIAAGSFREDLFYRLHVFPIPIPPLRERPEDIPPLIRYFVARYAQRAGKMIRHIQKRTLDQCQAYRWPGNIRELQNVVERAIILADTDTLVVDESWFVGKTLPRKESSSLSELAKGEIAAIEAALAASHGRLSGPSGAATKLGIPRQTLEAKLRKFGIDRYGGKK
jgi:formate hydrogenlyase transcriptional activator